MKKVIFIPFAILVMGFYQGCKTKEVDKTPSYVTIRGTIKGNGGVGDSIRIQFGRIVPDSNIGIKDTMIYTDSNGMFDFRSEDIKNSTRISIISFKKRTGEVGQRWKDILRNFIVEPGDNIQIQIDESEEELNYEFLGKGAQKFELEWQNFQLGYKINRKEIKRRYGNRFADLNTKIHIADSLSSLQLKQLETFKDSFSNRMFNILKADIYGENGQDLKTFWYQMHRDTMFKEKVPYYEKLVRQALNTGLSEDILASSPHYILFLSHMAMAQLQLQEPNNPNYHYENIHTYGIDKLCQIWRNQYSGILREKLLIYNLQDNRLQDTYGMEECLQLSHKLIKTPELKAIFETMYGRQIRGASAFNFSLPNTKGDIVRLSDFKGKVVYLDIWFTGCKGCMFLAKEVDHQVYPLFKDNPDVVFVSISGDKSKKRWLKSVDSELYGLKEYINLYTEGLGFRHSFPEYYGIEGGPTTMIIDREGRIYSSAPPKHGKSKDLVLLINEALEL